MRACERGGSGLNLFCVNKTIHSCICCRRQLFHHTADVPHHLFSLRLVNMRNDCHGKHSHINAHSTHIHTPNRSFIFRISPHAVINLRTSRRTQLTHTHTQWARPCRIESKCEFLFSVSTAFRYGRPYNYIGSSDDCRLKSERKKKKNCFISMSFHLNDCVLLESE